MKPTPALISFLIRSTIVVAGEVARTSPCYLLMGRHLTDL